MPSPRTVATGRSLRGCAGIIRARFCSRSAGALRKSLFVVCLGLAVWAMADPVPAGTTADILDRTQKFGRLCIEGEDCGGATPAPVVAVGRSGEAVYSRFCFACHATGVSEAPKFQDETDWAERLDKGMDVMVQTTIDGLNLMPPMGTCMDCSEEELAAAVDYMLPGGGS